MQDKSVTTVWYLAINPRKIPLSNAFAIKLTMEDFEEGIVTA